MKKIVFSVNKEDMDKAYDLLMPTVDFIKSELNEIPPKLKILWMLHMSCLVFDGLLLDNKWLKNLITDAMIDHKESGELFFNDIINAIVKQSTH